MPFSISVESFGPVLEGRVELGGFTLFYGRPNTGKSYTAKLIHSLIEAVAPRWSVPRGARLGLLDRLGVEPPRLHLLSQGPGRITLIDEVIRLDEVSDVLVRMYSRGLRRLLSRLFEEQWRRLLSNSTIRVETDNAGLIVRGGAVELHLDKRVELHLRVDLLVEDEESPIVLTYSCRSLRCRSILPPPRLIRENELAARVEEAIAVLVAYGFAEKVLGFIRSHYAPYGRSLLAAMSAGLRARSLRSLAARASFIASLLPEPFRGYLELLESSILSSKGASLVGLLRQRGGEALAMLARLLLEGEVELLQDEVGWRLVYRRDGLGLGLSETSAMVSEAVSLLYPLAMLLKSRSPRLLIVEEPESQLHPRAQRMLSWLLVAAARRISILVTTHSDYMLTEAAIAALLSTVERKKAAAILEELLEGGLSRSALDELLDAAGEAAIRVYLFDSGRITETGVERLTENIPTMTEHVYRQLRALRGLYEARRA